MKTPTENTTIILEPLPEPKGFWNKLKRKIQTWKCTHWWKKHVKPYDFKQRDEPVKPMWTKEHEEAMKKLFNRSAEDILLGKQQGN